MKKNILIAVVGIAATVAAYGQGKIFFGNYYSSTQTTGVSYGAGYGAYTGLGAGPEATVTLFWGASTDTSFFQLSPVAGSTTSVGLGVATGPGAFGTGAGWFLGPTLSINGGTAGNYAFAIEALSNLGPPFGFNEAFSPVVVGPTSATSTSPTPFLPPALYKGNIVFVMPEPSVLALSGIGAAALMLARRKKA
jgi:hypothetical protein